MADPITKTILNTVFQVLFGQMLNTLKYELSLAKEETEKKLKALLGGVVTTIVAVAFMIFASSILLVSGVAALSLIWPLWMSSLVVGGGVLVVGLILLLIGTMTIKRNKDLRPERAITALQKASSVFGADFNKK